MRFGAICLSLGLSLFAPGAPAAETFDNEAAYRELLTRADPSQVVEHEGNRYIRAPQGVARLPGGFAGAFERRRLKMPNGFEVEVVDPARPLRITSPAKPPEFIGVPERVAKIVEAARRIGMTPKVAALPEAIGGHRIEWTIGDAKPGGKETELFVHVGAPEMVKQVAKFNFDMMAARKDEDGAEVVKFTPAPGWAAATSGRVGMGKGGVRLGKHVGPNGGYMVGEAIGAATKDGVLVTVKAEKYDTEAFPDVARALRAQGASFEQTAALEEQRCLKLGLGMRPEIDNWISVLVQLVDGVDGVKATPDKPLPVVATPEKPAVEETKPTAPPVAPRPRPTGQQIMGVGRPRTLIGPRIERMVNEEIEWAAANPVKAAGSAMIAIGAALLATAAAPWTGAALVVGGWGAYQSTKPKPPPPELAPIRDAREKLEKYQTEWRRGFAEAELNDLGIFLDDLSKMTPEQRREVYKGNDIEFTSKAEYYRQVREEEARERAQK